jgi:F-type H+-transporting ATPase subunit b
VRTAVIHLHGSNVSFQPFASAEDESGTAEEVDEGPGPILPETKELAWGAGAFVVFAVLMRYVLVPKVKKGMDARYASIQDGHEAAESTRTAARSEVAEYEAQLAAVKAEATARVDAARQTLETERQAALADVNGRIAAARSAATAEADAAREAAQSHIRSAVGDVAGRASELATGRKPADDVVARVVGEVMAR